MSKTTRRDSLVNYLDEYLDIARIPDVSPNGLQVQGGAIVSRVALAVDASVETIRMAARRKANFLIVHHGLWWGKHVQIVGTQYDRIASLIRADISLYTAHIPLDCHHEVGNNVELARRLGLDVVGPFGEYRGIKVGVIAKRSTPVSRREFCKSISKDLGEAPDVLPFGPDRIRRVAIVSGAGAMVAEDAKNAGCDTLLTGERSHAASHLARESGINLVFAGHYASETVGVRALGDRIQERFQIKPVFLSAPTGY